MLEKMLGAYAGIIWPSILLCSDCFSRAAFSSERLSPVGPVSMPNHAKPNGWHAETGQLPAARVWLVLRNQCRSNLRNPHFINLCPMPKARSHSMVACYAAHAVVHLPRNAGLKSQMTYIDPVLLKYVHIESTCMSLHFFAKLVLVCQYASEVAWASRFWLQYITFGLAYVTRAPMGQPSLLIHIWTIVAFKVFCFLLQSFWSNRPRRHNMEHIESIRSWLRSASSELNNCHLANLLSEEELMRLLNLWRLLLLTRSSQAMWSRQRVLCTQKLQLFSVLTIDFIDKLDCSLPCGAAAAGFWFWLASWHCNCFVCWTCRADSSTVVPLQHRIVDLVSLPQCSDANLRIWIPRNLASLPYSNKHVEISWDLGWLYGTQWCSDQTRQNEAGHHLQSTSSMRLSNGPMLSAQLAVTNGDLAFQLLAHFVELHVSSS